MKGVVIFLGFMVMITVNALALAIVIDMTSAFHLRSADMSMGTLASAALLPFVMKNAAFMEGSVIMEFLEND